MLGGAEDPGGVVIGLGLSGGVTGVASPASAFTGDTTLLRPATALPALRMQYDTEQKNV